jgi:hypothetical protein
MATHELTLQVLESRIKALGDRTYIGWYALRDDAELIRLIVNKATSDEIEEHLKVTYPEYFDEEEQ